MSSTIFKRLRWAGGWAEEIAFALLALAFGFGLLPLLIFLAGSSILGRYDNASSGQVYEGVYQGLGLGSSASWIVVLGPYGLYLAFKGLLLWWRAFARPT